MNLNFHNLNLKIIQNFKAHFNYLHRMFYKYYFLHQMHQFKIIQIFRAAAHFIKYFKF